MLTSCPYCGAAVTGPKCEYCKTVFSFPDTEIESLRQETERLRLFKIQMLMNSSMLGIFTPNEIRASLGMDSV